MFLIFLIFLFVLLSISKAQIVNACDPINNKRPDTINDCTTIKINQGKCCFAEFKNTTSQINSKTCVPLTPDNIEEINEIQSIFTRDNITLTLDCNLNHLIITKKDFLIALIFSALLFF